MKGSLYHVEWGIEVETKGASLPLFQQVHGTDILQFHNSTQLSASTLQTLPEADGAIAYFSKAQVHVYTADCLPILFFTEDPSGPIAAVHAGWKGVRKGIVQRAYEKLSSFNSLHVLIGPAIGDCCFAVREDFILEWEEAGLSPQNYLTSRSGRHYFHLLNYVTDEVLSMLPKSHLHLDQFRCTACSQPPLPSFRRNKSANPRLRTWIRKLT